MRLDDTFGRVFLHRNPRFELKLDLFRGLWNELIIDLHDWHVLNLEDEVASNAFESMSFNSFLHAFFVCIFTLKTQPCRRVSTRET